MDDAGLLPSTEQILAHTAGVVAAMKRVDVGDPSMVVTVLGEDGGTK
jgi:hypothetical protein